MGVRFAGGGAEGLSGEWLLCLACSAGCSALLCVVRCSFARPRVDVEGWDALNIKCVKWWTIARVVYMRRWNFETGTTNAEKLILAAKQVRPDAGEVRVASETAE